MNECLLALCLALGAPDWRLTPPVEAFAVPTAAASAPASAATTAADTVPRAAPPRKVPRERVFGEDKWQHFFVSFIVTSLGASGARAAGLERDLSLGVGAGLSMTAGAAKELFDFHDPRGTPSALDLAWDLAGTGAGVYVASRAYRW